MAIQPFADFRSLATGLQEQLADPKTRAVLLYAYNGTGKTRLSMEFKDLRCDGNKRDTLYFNAFTEDLFHWDNDLESNSDRRLILNTGSHFFDGLFDLEMDNRIRPQLRRYADFDFRIDTQERAVRFSRNIHEYNEDTGIEASKLVDNIKVSRGEENLFIWCFFLAVVELAMDPEIEAYGWVKYLYIDDPISSLDENNAVMVAHHLAQILAKAPAKLTAVVSTHHVLFFNVLCHEVKKSKKYLLSQSGRGTGLVLESTDDTPFLYHLASLAELHEVERSGKLYTHHFNMLRRVMEQTARFFGYSKWDECIIVEKDDPERSFYKRVVDLMSHGDYSLYEPREMLQDNKEIFQTVFRRFIEQHPFDRSLFPEIGSSP